MLEAVIFVVFPFCMAFAAISDMMSMTIANRVSLILAASFLVIAPFTGMGWHVYGMHIVAGVGMLLITFSLFALGGMGGGDAKLIAATAFWMGLGPELMQYLLYSALAGGALTLFILLYRRSALSVYTGGNLFLRHLADRQEGVPYAIALGIGGMLVYPHTALVEWAVARVAGL
jgi:prepilin peptidase CpaA